MKKTLALMALVLSLGMTVALDAQAKRLGGAKSSGMQRQQTSQPATTPAGQPGSPAQGAPAAGTAAAAAAPAAAAAATKRSWMGPLAGLAAGLGLAALASHFGFGEGLANFMMIALLAVAVIAVIGFVMRKRAAGQNPSPAFQGAGAGAGAGGSGGPSPLGGTRIGSALGGGLATAAVASGAGTIPADFDAPAFARNAKTQFMALQVANDARDMESLKGYLTPDMFEVVREEIQARGEQPQKTEVFGLDAQVLDVAEETDRYVVSVRFRGSVRDQAGADTEDLDEVWHLTKPRTGFGGWVVAGIQQAA
ncbi:MAG TPA: Tim44-like domain-containing protein [Ramlibacter sp.]|nr:Tim44-like domain-containing protein [Ramlibacter sp.]